MQSDQQCYSSRKVVNSSEIQVVFDITDNNAVGARDFLLGTKLPRPVHEIELQPPENCSKNFVILDRTVDRSQKMFPPVIPQRFTYPGFDIHPTSMQNNIERCDRNEEKEISSSFSEDSDDINALLSLDNDLSWESEEEEVSTARTNGYDGSSSPDSCCNYSSKSKKSKISSFHESFGGGRSSSYNNKRRIKKMQNMVDVLRGIVPGGQQLSTVAVLDEAVKYLKSLKVEVEKHGVDNSKDYP